MAGTIDIKTLCTKLHNEEGYEYVCMIPTKSNIEVAFTDCSGGQGWSMKPTGMYFSKIVEIFSTDSHVSDSEEKELVPGWYSFLEYEWSSEMSKYSRGPLVFAKLGIEGGQNNEKIVEFSKDNFAGHHQSNFLGSKRYSAFDAFSTFDWKHFASVYDGVHVGLDNQEGIPWDVETVCMWNPVQLKDVKVFHSVGDFVYS